MNCARMLLAVGAALLLGPGGAKADFVRPVGFEPAAGPSNGDFIARARDYRVALDSESAVFVRDGAPPVRMRIVHAARVVGRPAERLPGTIHYVTGTPRTNVPIFGRIRYSAVLPGVDVEWYVNQHRVEYDVTLAAGVDAASVELHFEGAARIFVHNGHLVVENGGAIPLMLAPPRAHQLERPVGVRYVVDGERVRFAVDSYDRTQPLTIDPVIDWTTYAGTSSEDSIQALALSPAGEVVIAGTTKSSSNGKEDVFIARFAPDGHHLSTTFVGGTGVDLMGDLAIDRRGNIYIAGTTNSEDFPTTANGYQPSQPYLSLGGVLVTVLKGLFCDELCSETPGDGGLVKLMRGQDAFAMKFSPDAQAAVYSSYLGGAPALASIGIPGFKVPYLLVPGDEEASGIAVDDFGNMFVVGWTNSEFFPVTPSAGQDFLNKIAGAFLNPDAFNAIINTTRSGEESLIHGSYHGGTLTDKALDVAVDGPDIYYTGETDSVGPQILDISRRFPTANAIHPEPLGGDSDAFLVRLSPFGPWSTFLGTSGSDKGKAVVTHGGKVYVGFADGRVQKLDKSGTAQPEWTSHLGGEIRGLKIREFAGVTRLFAVRDAGTNELAIVHLDVGNGLQTEVTRFEAGGPVKGAGVDFDFRRLYFAGTTSSPALPGSNGGYSGSTDGFATAMPYNPAPQVRPIHVTVPEGTNAPLTLASVEGFTPFHLPYAVTMNGGNGATPVASLSITGDDGIVSGQLAYIENGTFAARVCLTESGDPTQRCVEPIVNVLNVRPTVTATSSQISPTTSGARYRAFSGGGVEVTISNMAVFTDPGAADTHTALVRWGDGTESAATIDPGKIVRGTHVYASSGSKAAEVCVADDDDPTLVCAPVTIEVPNADVAVNRDGPPEVFECGTATYTVTVVNAGPDAAPNVTLVDEIEPQYRDDVTYDAVPLAGSSDGIGTTEEMILNFGRFVIDGDIAVVGSDQLFVYERDSRTLRWRAASPPPAAAFTTSVGALALQGDTLAVSGTSYYDTPFNPLFETLVVYRKLGSTWSTPQELEVPELPSDIFDHCPHHANVLATGGDWIALADRVTCSQGSRKRIYLFRRSGETGNAWGTLEPDTTDNIGFGDHLALSSDGLTLYVAVPLDPQAPGSIWVYRWTGNAWSLLRKLMPPDSGSILDMDEDAGRLIVAHGNDRTIIYGVDSAIEAAFGPHSGNRSVAIDRSSAVALANGRVQIYSRNATNGWSEVASFIPSSSARLEGETRNPAVLDAIAMSGTTVMVRAMRETPISIHPNAFFFLSACAQTEAGRIECNLGTLPAGASRTYSITTKFGAAINDNPFFTPRSVATESSVQAGAADAVTSNNRAPATTPVRDIGFACDDHTPPVITPAVTGTAGDDGWYQSDVKIEWKTVDPETNISATTGCETTFVTSDTAGTQYTCVASSAGGTAAGTVFIRRDATPPAVAVTRIGSAARFDCSDATSGVVSCPPDAALVPGEKATRVVRDGAGNETTSTASVPLVSVSTNQRVQVGAQCRGHATLVGSVVDAVGSSHTVRWLLDGVEAGQALTFDLDHGPGQYVLEFRAANALGFAHSAQTGVEVVDTTAPVITDVPADVTLIQAGSTGVPYVVPSAAATDHCGAELTNDAPATFGVGRTPVTFTAVDPSGNVATATMFVTVEPRIDLAMSVATESPAVAGRDLIYRFTVRNDGPSNASGVTVQPAVPAATPVSLFTTDLEDPRSCTTSGDQTTCVRFTSLSPDVLCLPKDGVPTCAVGLIAAQSAKSFAVKVSVPPDLRGSLSSSASTRGLEPESSLSNNVASLEMTIGVESDRRITFTPPPTLAAGTTQAWVVTVNNDGPSNATAVSAEVVLPGAVRYVSGPSQCSEAEERIVCEFGSLAVGSAAQASLNLATDPAARGTAVLIASVRAAESDPVTANDSVRVEMTVTAETALTISTSLAASIVAGTSTPLTVDVTNVGPATATQTHVHITSPARLTITPREACTQTGSDVVCDAGTLGVSAMRRLILDASVDPSARGVIGNGSATATATETAAVVTATFGTNASAQADLQLAFRSTRLHAMPGERVEYELTVTNRGPSSATAVQLRVTLPSGAAVSVAPSGECTQSSALVVCALGDLAPAGGATIMLRIVPMAVGRLITTATVSSTDPDPVSSNNVVTIETNVNAPGGGPAGTADFDGDGDLDLAVVDENRDQVVFFRNDGTGRFTEAQRVNVGRRPVSLAIGQITGDAGLDVAVANSVSNDVSVLRNAGGNFAETIRSTISGQRPVSIAVGDVDGDGKLDLTTANELSGNVSILRNAIPLAEIQLVPLNLEGVKPSPARHPVSVVMTDIDGDGDLDLAAAHGVSDSVSILTNANGAFAESAVVVLPGGNAGPPAHHPSVIVAGNLGGDDRIDLAVLNRVSNSVMVLTNTTSGFAAGPPLAVGAHPMTMTAADFDGGFTLDLAVANRNDDSISVLSNQATGFAVTTRSGGKKPFAIVSGDFDGDGRTDLVSIEAKIVPFFVAGPLP